MLDLSLSVKKIKKLLGDASTADLAVALSDELTSNVPRMSLVRAIEKALQAAPPVEPERAREDDGTFLADDPATPDVDEAFVAPEPVIALEPVIAPEPRTMMMVAPSTMFHAE